MITGGDIKSYQSLKHVQIEQDPSLGKVHNKHVLVHEVKWSHYLCIASKLSHGKQTDKKNALRYVFLKYMLNRRITKDIWKAFSILHASYTWPSFYYPYMDV